MSVRVDDEARTVSLSVRDLAAEEIITFCRERLAAYRVPRIVEFRDDLPKSMIGKVLRRELREEEPQA